jgi:RNA polymerase sigma factor (sigma-70 family)
MRKLTPEQQRLAADNVGLAYQFASKNSPPGGMDYEEWESECLLRLCLAAGTYRPEMGWKFSTYAVRCLQSGWCHVQVHNTREMRDYRRRLTIGEMDVHIRDRSEKGACLNEVRAQLDALLARLPERERLVLRGRANGKFLTEIGRELGITRERVRQIQERALFRLWRYVRLKRLDFAGE